MNQLLLRYICGAVLLSLPFAGQSRGELITFQFAGTVTSVVVRGESDLQGFVFPSVGDPMTGFYRFDSTTPDSAQSSSAGLFSTALPDIAMHVDAGNLQFEAMSNGIN